MMDAQRLAQRAKALLDDDATKEAFAHIEQDLIAQWRSEQDPMQRDALWYQLGAIESLKGKLQSFADNGRLLAANK